MASLKRIDSKKGVLFDFDDTLAETKFGKNVGLKLASLKLQDYLKKEGVSIAFSGLYKKIQRITKALDDAGMYDRNFWWLSITKEFLLKSPRQSFLSEVTRVYWNATDKKSELYKDTLSTLAYLKKKKYALGMVSDTDGVKKMKSRRIRNLHLGHWFDAVVVAGENTKQTKPDKAPFLLALERLHLKPKQCVFVGNNLLVDVLGAKKAGLATVLIKRDGCKARVKPDRVIHTLAGLKKIL